MKVRKWFGKYFYLKLCIDRAHSYVNLPLDIAKDFMIFGTFLKVFMPGTTYAWIPIAFVLAICFAIIVGHVDIKKNMAHTEMSIRNQINPELIKILETVKEIVKKEENEKRRQKT